VVCIIYGLQKKIIHTIITGTDDDEESPDDQCTSPGPSHGPTRTSSNASSPVIDLLSENEASDDESQKSSLCS